jgi:hypothetical protein
LYEEELRLNSNSSLTPNFQEILENQQNHPAKKKAPTINDETSDDSEDGEGEETFYSWEK